MKKPKNPCYDCEFRNIHCHENCPKGLWIPYKKDLELWKETINNARNKEKEVNSYMATRRRPDIKGGHKK